MDVIHAFVSLFTSFQTCTDYKKSVIGSVIKSGIKQTFQRFNYHSQLLECRIKTKEIQERDEVHIQTKKREF